MRMGDGDGVVVRWTVWWVYWGMRGGTGDGVLEAGYMPALRTVYRGYRGMHGGTGVSMVGVPGMRGGTGEQYG